MSHVGPPSVAIPGAAPTHHGAPPAGDCTASDTPHAAAQGDVSAAASGTIGTCMVYACGHVRTKHAYWHKAEGHASPAYIRGAFWPISVNGGGSADWGCCF